MRNLAPELNVLLNHSADTSKKKEDRIPKSHQSTGGPNLKSPKNSKALTPVNEDYELLEYEWPDLPPLEQIRDALARCKISKSIDYLLPIDKTKNSVDGVYRTNLRAMFKEPYLTQSDKYSEEALLSLSKYHFNTSTLPTITRPKSDVDNSTSMAINQDSEKYRLIYRNSAPSHGIVGRDTTIENLRQRSSLNFPLKQRLPPEAQKLKDEAERILKSVQERDRDQEDDYDPALHDRQILNEQAMGKYRKSPDKRRPIQSRRSLPSREMMKSLVSRGRAQAKTISAKFKTYDELKRSEVPVKREMPSRLRSRYMSDTKSEAVWDWLNEDEKITDFSYFLEVCT